MIVHGDSSLTYGIQNCWNRCFTQEDPRYTEFFFRNLFQPDWGYAVVENDQVVSTLCRIPHDFVFNGRILKTSMIVGVATLPEARKQGYMHQLMNTVLDACEHAELITLIQAYDLQLYLPFGFQVLYERSFYTLDRDDVQRTNNVGCVYDPPALDLLKCYSAYISRFNGFYARDLDYFVSYKKEIAAEGGKVIGYYGQDHQIQAYCTMLLDRQKADVEEIIYLDSLSLIKMINAALQERNTITINVSKAENLSLLFPRAPREDRGSTLVRLNNPELYSRLFNTKVETVQEAFALSEKPLNLSEHF